MDHYMMNILFNSEPTKDSPRSFKGFVKSLWGIGKRGVVHQLNKAFNGRSLGYYGSYKQGISPTNGKINARDSETYSTGVPISSNLLDSSYASAPSYSQSYSATAYAAPASYSYDDEDLVLHDYDQHHQKKKKLALGIALPLSLVLGPLAIVGILALVNLRTVFTIALIRNLCTNETFSANFTDLCTLVSNLKKRSSNEADNLQGISDSFNLSQWFKFLNSKNFTALDHLNSIPEGL